MTTRLLQPETFDVSDWSFEAAGVGKGNAAIARIVAAALRDRFSNGDACRFEFGAAFEDGETAKPTDLVMTLPFQRSDDAWQGPLLVISLDDIVQEMVTELDQGADDLPDAEAMAQLRDGFHAIANKLSQALHRNAEKIAHAKERRAPRW